MPTHTSIPFAPFSLVPSLVLSVMSSVAGSYVCSPNFDYTTVMENMLLYSTRR